MSDTTKPQPFNEWALVELFGHQKIVGKVSEATMAGGAFLRVDVPSFNGAPAFTRFYSPGAVYSINPVSEEIARGLMETYRNEPVSRFELPQLADKVLTSSRSAHEPDEYERNDRFDDEEEEVL